MIKPIPVKPKEIKPKPVIVKSIGLFRGKKAVFGLNAVQAFFAIILGLAILAYVIVILMGILGNAMIIPHNTVTIYNELGYINQTVDTFNQKINSTYTNPTNCRVLNAINYSSGLVISSGNYTINYAGCLWTNSTNVTWNNVTFNYTMEYDSNAQNQLNSITGNTSTGITGFFSSVSPVYAILAVLVIILVLIVLVRVVQNRQGTNESPSL